jgi:hypothetical protein
MGNRRTKSNGRGEGKEESMNFVETIHSLQRDVLIYKVDNEKLRKVKEKQYGINNRLLQSLDRIEKKVDKGTYSIKSKSHKYHAKRGESRSVYKRHHHLPRNSVKRE